MAEASCGNCFFYRFEQCRRRAPVPTGKPFEARWPDVSGHMWCGEHTPVAYLASPDTPQFPPDWTAAGPRRFTVEK